MDKTKKIVVFDLDTKVCEKILGTGYRRIYDIIKKHMKDNGFLHIQGNGYMSCDKMSTMQVYYTIFLLTLKHPYMTKCVRDIRCGDVSELISLNKIFSYDGTPGTYARDNQIKPPENDGRER